MESAYIAETILRMTFSLVAVNLSCWVKKQKGKKCKSKCALTRPVFRAIQNVFRDIGHLAEVAVADELTSLDFAFQDCSQEGPATLLLQI